MKETLNVFQGISGISNALFVPIGWYFWR